MGVVINRAVDKKFCQKLTFKKRKQKILKKAAQNKKFLIARIHDNIKFINNFSARPIDRPSIPIVCEIDQLLSETLQIIKKQWWILVNYPVKFAKNGNILIPKYFFERRISN